MCAPDTPGSDVIERAILDDDPRTLWLLSWGGMNTIVRALISIAEEHRDAPDWEAVRARVCTKVRVMGVAQGVGQDNSWLDHGRALFPDLVFLRAPFAYGGYVDAVAAQPDSIELFRAPWPEQHLTRGNGSLMARYMLYGTRYLRVTRAVPVREKRRRSTGGSTAWTPSASRRAISWPRAIR